MPDQAGTSPSVAYEVDRLGDTAGVGRRRVLGHHWCGRQSRDRLERRYFTGPTPPRPEEVTSAFWGACHGGQEPCADFLLDRGADLNWIPPWEELTSLDAAQRSGATELVAWLRGQGANTAAELSTS